MNNKKSQAKYLIWVVFFAALIVVTLVLVWNFRRTTEAKTAEAICLADIETYSSEWFKEEEPKIRCPTEDITITVTNNNRILEQISRFMYKCSKRYEGGKKQVFGDEWIVYCDVCYMIDFKTKEKITGLKEYLQTHKNPEGMIHMNYLFGWETEGSPQLLEEISNRIVPEGDLDPTKDYAVIFVNPKGPTNIERTFSQAFFAAAVSPVTLVMDMPVLFQFGEPAWAAFTILREYEESKNLKELCNYLPITQSLE